MDWENPDGRLIVAELPAGEYEIYRWESTDGQVFINAADSFSIPFEVFPGRATYIGGIVIAISMESYRGSWGSKLRKVGLQIRNQSERDLKIFLNRYQRLSVNDVTIKIATYNQDCLTNLVVKCDNATPPRER